MLPGESLARVLPLYLPLSKMCDGATERFGRGHRKARGDVARYTSGNNRGRAGSSPLSRTTERRWITIARKGGYRDEDHFVSGCFEGQASMRALSRGIFASFDIMRRIAELAAFCVNIRRDWR